MGKYKAIPFTVTIVWFEGSEIKKRKFRKYQDAAEWAERNLDTDEIIVRIIGGLIKQEETGDIFGKNE